MRQSIANSTLLQLFDLILTERKNKNKKKKILTLSLCAVIILLHLTSTSSSRAFLPGLMHFFVDSGSLVYQFEARLNTV